MLGTVSALKQRLRWPAVSAPDAACSSRRTPEFSPCGRCLRRVGTAVHWHGSSRKDCALETSPHLIVRPGPKDLPASNVHAVLQLVKDTNRHCCDRAPPAYAHPRPIRKRGTGSLGQCARAHAAAGARAQVRRDRHNRDPVLHVQLCVVQRDCCSS